MISKPKKKKEPKLIKNKPLFSEIVSNFPFQKEKTIDNKIKIILNHKTYTFCLNTSLIENFFSETKNVKEILENFESYKILYEKKQSNQINELSSIAEFSFYTIIDSFFEHIDLLISEKIKKSPLQIDKLSDDDLDRCCICLCSLYEDILEIDSNTIIKSLEEQNDDDVIKLEKCTSHYFHKNCLLSYKKDSEYIKCPICGFIYGTMCGDQPEGYEQYSTICIDYDIRSSVKNGIRIPSTRRSAFLPDCPEGNEILNLFLIAFERKLIFTVGTSVTSGAKNVVVWNGIHHKTNLNGGSAFFGYPDPTYFKRVRYELAAKGIV